MLSISPFFISKTLFSNHLISNGTSPPNPLRTCSNSSILCSSSSSSSLLDNTTDFVPPRSPTPPAPAPQAIQPLESSEVERAASLDYPIKADEEARNVKDDFAAFSAPVIYGSEVTTTEAGCEGYEEEDTDDDGDDYND